jgi:hypothetical protein
MSPSSARPPTTPPTMPPIAPPDRPELLLDWDVELDVDVAEEVVAVLAVLAVLAELAELAELDGVGVGERSERLTGKAVAEGLAERREE